MLLFSMLCFYYSMTCNPPSPVVCKTPYVFQLLALICRVHDADAGSDDAGFCHYLGIPTADIMFVGKGNYVSQLITASKVFFFSLKLTKMLNGEKLAIFFPWTLSKPENMQVILQ